LADNEAPEKNRKAKTKRISCSKCGTVINPKENPPLKTWNLVSPMPDKEGRVTLTIMASFECPGCGKSLRAALQKIKGDEIDGTGASKRRLLLERLGGAQEKLFLEDLARELGMSQQTVTRAAEALCNAKRVRGRVSGDFFYPE
jgi:transcription initiation factor TFIIIB Brf1 subunit/transcription initiation factor TFIIB